MKKKLWQGRFDTPLSAAADAFNQSISFDRKLFDADIDASLAHAAMLGQCGILTEEEAERIRNGLNEIRADVAAGMEIGRDAEDIHSFVEGELVERIGDTGKD